MLFLGVDLGGTKIEAAALSATGDLLARERVATPQTYDAALGALVHLVRTVEQRALTLAPALVTAPGIGVGAPGSVSPRTGVVRNANAAWLNGRRFAEDLEAALGRPVKLSNDANCLALSEAMDGAAAGASSVAAIILGTGCGGGFVVNGRLLEGANGLAGELGHISLPWPSAAEVPGPACWCGQRGCVETYVSGTGLARDFLEHSGRRLTAHEIIAAAETVDPEAQAAVERLVSRLGRTVALLANTLDPQVFVFGGGLSNASWLYDRLLNAAAPFVFSDGWSASFVPARWGDSSGVRGAAYLWKQATDPSANTPREQNLTYNVASADAALPA